MSTSDFLRDGIYTIKKTCLSISFIAHSTTLIGQSDYLSQVSTLPLERRLPNSTQIMVVPNEERQVFFFSTLSDGFHFESVY